jgi:hypothetical protein
VLHERIFSFSYGVRFSGARSQDLSMLADPQRGPLWVMKAGQVYRDRLHKA